jgi:hypothetical protein
LGKTALAVKGLDGQGRHPPPGNHSNDKRYVGPLG